MRKLIIGLILEGGKDTAIARAVSTKRLTVTRQAIGAFRRRHAEALRAREEKNLQQVDHRWIANKDKRLGKLEAIFAGLEAVVDTYGFMVTTEEATGKEGERTIYDQHFNGALAAQMRGVLSDASDELGQKPKTPVNVNIDNRVQQVFIRQVVGAQAELG